MENEMICPVMSRGWLSNKWAAADDKTFEKDNLCPCFKEKCGMWVKTNFSGYCGYQRR